MTTTVHWKSRKSFHFRWSDDRSMSALPIHGIRHFLSGHFLCSNSLLFWTSFPIFLCSHSWILHGPYRYRFVKPYKRSKKIEKLGFFPGSNVSILRLWNDIKGPIYFSCLHFSFGVGNLLGPIMAELILESSSDKSSNNTSDVSASPIIQPEMDQVEYDTWISLLKSKPISRLQVWFYRLSKQVIIFLVTLCEKRI